MGNLRCTATTLCDAHRNGDATPNERCPWFCDADGCDHEAVIEPLDDGRSFCRWHAFAFAARVAASPSLPDPWHITVTAIRRYQSVVATAPHGLTEARRELADYARRTRERYDGDVDRVPQINQTGAEVYRGPGPERLRLVVSVEVRTGGRNLVDVLPESPRSTGGYSDETKRRRNQRRREQRARKDG